MLDFSLIEFLIIVVLGVLVLGPKDLPVILYQLGKVVRRLQYMRFALSNQFDDFMQHAELSQKEKEYQKPTPIYDQDEEDSPFSKEPFHQPEDDYDPDMEEDEEYVEQELSFFRDLREGQGGNLDGNDDEYPQDDIENWEKR